VKPFTRIQISILLVVSNLWEERLSQNTPCPCKNPGKIDKYWLSIGEFVSYRTAGSSRAKSSVSSESNLMGSASWFIWSLRRLGIRRPTIRQALKLNGILNPKFLKSFVCLRSCRAAVLYIKAHCVPIFVQRGSITLVQYL